MFMDLRKLYLPQELDTRCIPVNRNILFKGNVKI